MVYYRHLDPFSITCIAAFYRHPSFDMLNKQDGPKPANHSSLAWPSELVGLHLYETNTDMHRFWLGNFKQHVKYDVERWMKKDNYARNTESGCNDYSTHTIPVLSLQQKVPSQTKKALYCESKVSCPRTREEHNAAPRPGLEPGPFDSESSALTIRPPRLPRRHLTKTQCHWVLLTVTSC